MKPKAAAITTTATPATIRLTGIPRDEGASISIEL